MAPKIHGFIIWVPILHFWFHIKHSESVSSHFCLILSLGYGMNFVKMVSIFGHTTILPNIFAASPLKKRHLQRWTNAWRCPRVPTSASWWPGRPGSLVQRWGWYGDIMCMYITLYIYVYITLHTYIYTCIYTYNLMVIYIYIYIHM